MLINNVNQLKEMLTACRLCPRHCGVDRTAGEFGKCGIGTEAKVSSAMPHFGEEAVLVGGGGSGTIFFSGCNLECVFCQNYDISQSTDGRACSSREIAALGQRLAEAGCENINFVTPTHVVHAVAEAILIVRSLGIKAPTVYNCGGYESVEVLGLLAGLIDIYMPDFKYADAERAKKYSGIENYPAVATAALAEMYRQAGPLELTKGGVARKGVLVRHLVMPNDLAHSKAVIEIVARTAPGCTINVMGQYRPSYRAREYPELMDYPLSRTIRSLREYAGARGLKRNGVES
ncbi:MAG: hypothetical protein AMJ79_04820 [Phycisphaerae bacterium SM23_30]|nr:MAG: hypothetical protein AMJ79_04820 [Phycisphaerae bacterium SM23_30]